jgi:predicted transcriptional regulator
LWSLYLFELISGRSLGGGMNVIKVRDIMIKEVITSKGEITIHETIKIFHEKHVGSIVVVDQHNRPIGIFTERDAIRCIAVDKPLDTLLEEEMTRNVITIMDNICFRELRVLYSNKQIRHFPVVDEHNHLEGIVNIRAIFDEILGC